MRDNPIYPPTKFAPGTAHARASLFSIITLVFVLGLSHLTEKQAFLAATLLVAAYGVPFKGGRLPTLVLTAAFITIAAGTLVYLVAR